MSRLQTMARFKEPDNEPAPVTYCDCCGSELYEGDFVVKFDNEIFCDSECFLNHMGVQEEPLEKEVY